MEAGGVDEVPFERELRRVVRRVGLLDLDGRLEPAQPRHGDVQQHDVGRQLDRLLDRLLPVRRLADHLAANGVKLSIRRGALRFSLHLYNNMDDVARVHELTRAFLNANADLKDANPKGYQNVQLWGEAQEKAANAPPPKPPAKAAVSVSLKGEDLGSPAVQDALSNIGRASLKPYFCIPTKSA